MILAYYTYLGEGSGRHITQQHLMLNVHYIVMKLII